MPRSEKKLAATSARLDALVATYAPIGSQHKRKKDLRRAAAGGGGVFVVGAIALLSQSDMTLVERLAGALPQTTVTMSSDDAIRLENERVEMTARINDLETRLAAVQAHEFDLEAQRAEFERQSQRLASLLDATDSDQRDLERKQHQGSQLDQEIAAIAAQRKALEARWAQFEAQGELLAMEIIAVNAQRKELETQRLQIDRQRKELAELLERADGLYRSGTRSADGDAPQDVHTTAAEEPSFIQTPNSLMVNNGELDSMRGGFSIGEGLDVSFGFSQTGSVNGVEQFQNNFTIDSVGSAYDNIDMSDMNSVLLQNGSGNFVSASVLDSLADSFGNIIQNTLDDQVISTTTIYDISLHNLPGTLQGFSGEQALMDSLGAF